MNPWDLAGEASDETASSVGLTGADAGVGADVGAGADDGIGAVGSLTAFEVGGSTGAKDPKDDGSCA